jgi:hypothetical protein
MTPQEIKRCKEKMIAVYRLSDEICLQDKDADRDMVVQSLLMREQTPLENLDFSLLRGQVLKSDRYLGF